MLSRLLLSAGTAFLLASCAPSGPILVGSESTALGEVIESTQGKLITVTLLDSSVHKGEAVESGPDTLVLSNVLLSRPCGSAQTWHSVWDSVPFKNVARIRLKETRSLYMAMGALLGVVGGGAAAYAIYPDPHPAGGGTFGLYLDPGKGIVVAGGAILGGVAGSMIGGAIAPNTEYILHDTTHNPVIVEVGSNRPLTEGNALELGHSLTRNAVESPTGCLKFHGKAPGDI